MRRRGILRGHILPMAFQTHRFNRPPQLGRITVLQIMADATGSIAEGLMDEIEAVDWRRA